MERPRRTHAEARAQMRAGILRLGNAQLAEVGAAALSVREIARGLEVAPSAIYRHVANRDDLLTLLIASAYSDLADAALAELGEGSTAERFAGLVHGMRAWAIANPARWSLAYGTPVPGYAAPAAETTEPGTRVMAVFLDALASGQTPPDLAAAEISTSLTALLRAGSEELGITVRGGSHAELDPKLGVAAVQAWSGLIGLISAEIFGQLGSDFMPHGAEILEHWITSTIERFKLG